MAIDTIAITPGSGQFLDAFKLNNGSVDVEREVTVIGSPTVFGNVAEVSAAGELKIAGAITNTYLDYSLATIDTDIKANITLHAGTNVIGKVSQDTSPWVVGGAAAAGANVSTDSTPLLISGSDYGGTPVKRNWKVDNAGTGYVTLVGGSASIGAISYATPTTSTLLQAAISFSANGNNVVIAGVAAQTIHIYKMWIVFGGTCNFKFGDNTPTYFSGAAPASQLGSFTLVLDGDPHYITAAGKGFTINTDAAVQVSGTVWYTQS